MLFTLLCCLLVSQLAHAGNWVNINKEVDLALENANIMLTEQGFGIRKVPDVQWGPVNISGNFIIGQDSNYRTGDCRVLLENGVFAGADVHAGYRLYTVAFRKMRTINSTMDFSGYLALRGVSSHVGFRVEGFQTDSCNASLTDFEVESVGESTLALSQANDVLDVSQYVLGTILPSLNSQLQQIRPLVEAALQRRICHSRIHNHHESVVSFITEVFNV